MKFLTFCLLLFLLAGCVSKAQIVNNFVEEAQREKALQDWSDGVWKFEIAHKYQEFNYSFTGFFSRNKYNYETCMWLPHDEPWMTLEIQVYETNEKTQKDIVAAYKLDGAYLEIYVPSNLCDHSFEILRTRVTKNRIYGFQTYDHITLGKTTVPGEVNAYRLKHPNKFKNENASDAGTDAASTRRPF